MKNHYTTDTYEEQLEREPLLEACPWPWFFDDCECILYDANELAILRLSRPFANGPMSRGYDQDLLAAGLIAVAKSLAGEARVGQLAAGVAYRLDPDFQRMLDVAPRLWRRAKFGECGDVLDGSNRPVFSCLSTRGESEREREHAIRKKIIGAVNGTDEERFSNVANFGPKGAPSVPAKDGDPWVSK